jgi:hypothetical protein
LQGAREKLTEWEDFCGEKRDITIFVFLEIADVTMIYKFSSLRT